MEVWTTTACGNRRWRRFPSAIALWHTAVGTTTRTPEWSPRGDYSAIVDADDLAALIRKLKLAPAHIVGVSYGAYVALFLAARHPELVRSLVLSEPPVLRWLPELGGR